MDEPAVNETEFQQRVVAALELHSPELVAVLRQLVAHDYPPDVASVDFEVFPDGFTSGFPVRAFFMDDSNSEFFVIEDGEARCPSSVDPGLLDISRVYEDSLEAELEGAVPDADSFTLAAEAVIPWFARCWAAAGGREFTRRAGISLHDDVRRYDLVQDRWHS